jgi:hypothetical protein
VLAAAELLLIAEVGSFHGAWQPIVNALLRSSRTAR